MPAEHHRQQRPVGQDPVLLHEPRSAAAPSRAGARHDVERKAFHADPVSLFADLDRDRVGLAVPHANEHGLSVGDRARTPAARLRLHQEGLLTGVGMRRRDRRRADGDVASRREPFGQQRGQRLPHQVARLLRRLEVRRDGSRPLGGEDRSRRAHDPQRTEPAVRGRLGRIRNRFEDRANPRDQPAPGGVHRPAHLRVRPGEVADHLVGRDRDRHPDREGAASNAVVVDQILSRVRAGRQGRERGPRERLAPLVHRAMASRTVPTL